MKGLIVIVLFVALIVFMPCLVIWSLDTLFGLHIDYSVKSWFAVLVLSFLVGGSKISYKAS
jgi:hypothetical protein